MDYSRAIRIARALADMPQRELAKRIDVDASLISMFESALRKPSLDTLERIADAIGIPFHLFTLLATERKDASSVYRQEMKQLAIGLSRLLLEGKQPKDESAQKQRRDHRAKYAERKQAGIHAQRRARKAS